MSWNTEEWMAVALETTNTVVWEWRIGPDEVRAVPETSLLFDSKVESSDDFFARIHPDDRRSVEKAVESLVESGTPYSSEYRIEIGDEIRWIESHGQLAMGEESPERVLGISRDITQRKQAERERRALLDRMTDAFFSVDEDWYITNLNERGGEILAEAAGEKLSISEVEGSNLWDVISEAVGSTFYDKYHEAMATQEPVYFEEYYAPLGVWFDVRAYPSATGLSVFFRDITERKAREQRLARREAQFRSITETATDAIIEIDAESVIRFANPAVEDLFGYSPAEVEGQSLLTLMPERFHDRHREGIAQYLETGERHIDWSGAELPGLRKDGEEITLSISFAEHEIGDERRFTGIIRDVTERKQRERELQHYKRAVEQSSDLLTSIDPEKNYRLANQKYREFYGIERESILGASPGEVLDADTWDVVEPHIERALAGESVHYRTSRSRPNQAPRVFDVRYDPLESPDSGEPMGVIGSLRDITTYVDQERQLKVLDRVLRHNIRNEMNIVLGYAETIIDEATGDIAKHAEMIESRGEQLMDLAEKQREITNVLSEPRKIELIDTSRLVRPVNQLRESHPEAEISLTVPDNAQIRTIPQIERAIEELVDNAIRHTTQDTPEIEVTIENLPGAVEIHVADNGPGIPAQEREILMGEEEISPVYHGTGLGLWLVNWVVSRAGGTLRFEENEPRGSIVKIRLPREPPQIEN